jgi:predicted AAA+ superfamily ATPase
MNQARKKVGGIDTPLQERLTYNPGNPSNSSASSKGKIYLFIDEIQYLNNASSFIKLMVDNHYDRFKLIVSGSLIHFPRLTSCKLFSFIFFILSLFFS